MDKLERAMDLLNQGKFEDARPILEEIVADNPRDWTALYNLGMCFTELGYPERAIKALEQSVKYKPDHSNSYVALGVAHSKMNDFDSAKRHFAEALRINSKNSFALRNLGGLLGKLGQMEESLRYLEEAYHIDASDPKTVYGLGHVYQHVGNDEKADKFYRQVVKMDAPAPLKDLAKDGLREIAWSHLKAKGLRMDAVLYLLSALKFFGQKSEDEVRRIAFEIAMRGTKGFDINNPDKTYTLNNLEGQFTGLQLVCYMYVGFKKIAPEQDIGMSLSDEYALALKLFKGEDV